ncbi:hypothetical protein SAMN05660349_02232 [Macellibacteroides fermentans]|uniref:Uncharacterized protein n=1 Tax=Parabacteroides chartae TaxID=1037355 RepID=A0A1T5D4Y8_9BACT|nr:hypothetical protein SAMN05660349_02232 [Parabacteroides chartae]
MLQFFLDLLYCLLKKNKYVKDNSLPVNSEYKSFKDTEKS